MLNKNPVTASCINTPGNKIVIFAKLHVLLTRQTRHGLGPLRSTNTFPSFFSARCLFCYQLVYRRSFAMNNLCKASALLEAPHKFLRCLFQNEIGLHAHIGGGIANIRTCKRYGVTGGKNWNSGRQNCQKGVLSLSWVNIPRVEDYHYCYGSPVESRTPHQTDGS